jgi:hypothetical protein
MVTCYNWFHSFGGAFKISMDFPSPCDCHTLVNPQLLPQLMEFSHTLPHSSPHNELMCTSYFISIEHYFYVCTCLSELKPFFNCLVLHVSKWRVTHTKELYFFFFFFFDSKKWHYLLPLYNLQKKYIKWWLLSLIDLFVFYLHPKHIV